MLHAAAALAAFLIPSAGWAGEAPSPTGLIPRNWFLLSFEWAHSFGILGIVMAIILALAVAMSFDLLFTLRLTRLVPDSLLSEIQDVMANGEYEQALSICEKSGTLIGQVFAAPLSKTDYPFQRMKEAMLAELRVQGLIWRQWIGHLEIGAPLGILLGLAMAAIEALRFVSELAGRPNPMLAITTAPELRLPIQSGLIVLLFGLSVSIISRIVSGICIARLDYALVEAERVGEELLDSFRPLPHSPE
jgi:biopolymer transport protein ExbB